MTSRNHISSKFTSTLGEIAGVSSINIVFVEALSLVWVISLIIHSQKGRPVGLTHAMISALAHFGFSCPIHAGGGLRRRRWRRKMDLSSARSKTVVLVSGCLVDHCTSAGAHSCVRKCQEGCLLRTTSHQVLLRQFLSSVLDGRVSVERNLLPPTQVIHSAPLVAGLLV